MSRKKRTGEDDDGRTIADMSGVAGPSMLQPRQAESHIQNTGEHPEPSWEMPPLRGKERWMFVLGALKATLLIAFAFLGGLGLLIFLLLQIWT